MATGGRPWITDITGVFVDPYEFTAALGTGFLS
jgi:hypothetical protein